MVFMPESYDKHNLIDSLYQDYWFSSHNDPVVWVREYFAARKPKMDDLHIRGTFTAKTYL